MVRCTFCTFRRRSLGLFERNQDKLYTLILMIICFRWCLCHPLFLYLICYWNGSVLQKQWWWVKPNTMQNVRGWKMQSTNQVIALFRKIHFETPCIGYKTNIYLYLDHWFYIFQYSSYTILYLYQLGMLTIFRAFRWWKIRPTMAGSNLILKRRFVERFAKFVLGCTNEKRFELNIALWS